MTFKKIAIDATHAFLNKENFKRDDTRVLVKKDQTIMFFNGHAIATKHHNDGRITITNCGFDIGITKERLNCILHYLGCEYFIYEKDLTWYWKINKLFPYNTPVIL